jgi:hypothetical protein
MYIQVSRDLQTLAQVATYIPLTTTNLRRAQDPKLTIARGITRHIQPARSIPPQPRRPKAPRAKTRPIPLTTLHTRIVKDILGGRSTRQRLDRRILPIGTKLEAHGHKLKPRDGRAVPGAVVSNVHCARTGVKLAVDRGRVGEQGELGRHGFLVACVVVEGAVGRLHEEVADLEGFVGEVGGLPDGEAGWIAVPVVVGLGHVAHVVDFLAWVVLVHVSGGAVDGALEVVATVLDAPEPWGSFLAFGTQIERGGKDLHVVLVEAHADLIALAVPGGVAARDVVVSATRDLAQIEDFDDCTAGTRAAGSRINIGVGAVRNDK